ncbi:MAG: hypothetical protein SFH39_13465 [Candidatus Magnetobacterium sp. LHC-1]
MRRLPILLMLSVALVTLPVKFNVSGSYPERVVALITPDVCNASMTLHTNAGDMPYLCESCYMPVLVLTREPHNPTPTRFNFFIVTSNKERPPRH